MANRVDEILKTCEQLVSEQTQYTDTWQQITDLMCPGRRRMFGVPLTGDRGTGKLFDGTAISNAHLLAASIHGSMTSPDIYWATLKAQHDEVNDDHPCAMWLDDATRRIHWHYQQSNLYSEIPEDYGDLILYGTSCLYSEEKDPSARQFSGFRKRAIPVGEFVIAENADGVVDTVFRPYMELTAQAIVQRWPDTAPDRVKRLVATDPFTKVKLIHGVWPRVNGRVGGFASAMPFQAAYVLTEDRVILEEGGYNECPYQVSRWWKTPGEVYGRGPGWFALPDTKSMNLAKELELTGWALAIRPPIKRLEHGIVGRLRLTPGGETLVQDMTDVQPILATKTDWQATQVKTQEIAHAIREVFFREQLELVQSDRMTATEVEQRVALMQRFLGPTLGRLTSELLQPMFQRDFLILYRRGALLPPPPAMVDYIKSGGALQIRYEGPLAKAQRLTELQSVNRAVQTMLPMAQVNPALASMFDNLDPDGVADVVLDAAGVPARARKDPKVRDAARQQVAQQMAMQRELDAASQVAEGAGRVAPLAKAMQEQPGQAA